MRPTAPPSATAQGIGTITNDDGAAIAGSVSINDVTISEGDSGTKVATFTVTRSGGTAAFDVNFATSNGTATVADSDYVANFRHAASSAPTRTRRRSRSRSTATPSSRRTRPSSSFCRMRPTAPPSVTVRVLAPSPTMMRAFGSVSINDVTISEGDSGTKVATFTVTRTGGTAAFNVNFATSNGSATLADGDYVAELRHAELRRQRHYSDALGHGQRRHQDRVRRDLLRQPVGGDQRRHHQRQSGNRHYHQ